MGDYELAAMKPRDPLALRQSEATDVAGLLGTVGSLALALGLIGAGALLLMAILASKPGADFWAALPEAVGIALASVVAYAFLQGARHQLETLLRIERSLADRLDVNNALLGRLSHKVGEQGRAAPPASEGP